MDIPKLKIGNITAKLPIIQGGMAVRVSTAPLVSAVANTGAIGLIGASGMPIGELKKEIRKARQMTEGIIGINIMVATRRFADAVKLAIKERVDLIVAGAGFSRDIFTLGQEAGIPIVPIVSSDKFAKLSERLGASAVIVEGKEAGGHLGTDKSTKNIIDRVIDAVKIPVIAAGGIKTGEDIVQMLRAGASGVQIGTRFVATEECTVSDAFKQMYVDAKDEDVVLIESPVGMVGRAIRNSFVERLEKGVLPRADWCKHLCLKNCSRRYCIIEALINAQKGDIDNGLVFAGESVSTIKEILSVREVMNRLTKEIQVALQKVKSTINDDKVEEKGTLNLSQYQIPDASSNI